MTMNSVLVIDKDPGIGHLLQLVLGRRDCDVHTVTSSAAARALLARRRFDLLVLDPQLPDREGDHLVHHLRAQHQVDAPVIVLSAGGRAGASAGTAAVADDYVPKPFLPAHLAARVRWWLANAAHARGAQAR